MTTAKTLRRLAADCRTLARTAASVRTRHDLRRIAEDYERDAARIDAALGLGRDAVDGMAGG